MRQKDCGFTLIEMAMVLVIVAFLLGGLLMPLSTQVEQRKISETQKALEEIKEALTGYAIANGRVPCPANGTIASGAANAGLENTSGSGAAMTCVNAGGVLPWATLGVNETDAWGRRFTYRVTPSFADGADGTGTGSCAVTAGISFQLCSNGNLNVFATAGGTSVASNVPAMIVSHGANGLGAYMPNGVQLGGAAGDENENADNDNTFVSKIPTSTFDDLVTWITPNILLNRMVAAGRLP